MLSPWIVLPSVGAAASALAGLDAHFGGHTVDWLVALCLADPDVGMDMPTMPMQHGSAMPFAAAACGCASAALMSAWWQHGQDARDLATSTDPDFAALAVLAMLANVQGQARAPDLTMAVIAATGRAPEMDADVALDIFTPDAVAEDLRLFAGLARPEDRACVICAALDFARVEGADVKLLHLTGRIALAMRMGPLEMWRHWHAHRRAQAHPDIVPTPTRRPA